LPPASDSIRILSWNVNGLRACAKRGFGRFLARSGAFVVGVQEVRARAEQLPRALARPRGWHLSLVAAERPGYSGVALFSRTAPDRVETELGIPRFDREGRFQLARFGRLALANVYFPKGSGSARDNSRVPYKLEFYDAVLERLQAVRRGGARVVVMGDFNTAHTELDLARPRDNRRNSGFLPEERRAFACWIEAGFVDVFRREHPEAGHYTWWRQWGGARERNVGWRIDYLLASRAAARHVRSAFLLPAVRGSDHCPVGADFDPAVLGPVRGQRTAR
jgi:exodeoxyribonuclease-3